MNKPLRFAWQCGWSSGSKCALLIELPQLLGKAEEMIVLIKRRNIMAKSQASANHTSSVERPANYTQTIIQSVVASCGPEVVGAHNRFGPISSATARPDVLGGVLVCNAVREGSSKTIQGGSLCTCCGRKAVLAHTRTSQ